MGFFSPKITCFLPFKKLPRPDDFSAALLSYVPSLFGQGYNAKCKTFGLGVMKGGNVRVRIWMQ